MKSRRSEAVRHFCDCGNPAVKEVSGNGYACQRCLDIESRFSYQQRCQIPAGKYADKYVDDSDSFGEAA